MARKEKNDPTVTVQFTKPTLDFAVGDVVELTESYLDEVVDEYIKNNFAPDLQDRYESVTGKLAAKAKVPDVTLDELREEAVGLGIDTTDLKTRPRLEKAIADATV